MGLEGGRVRGRDGVGGRVGQREEGRVGERARGKEGGREGERLNPKTFCGRGILF